MLLFGSDACLLESRRMLLEFAGYKVFSTLQLMELNRILCSAPIDLLILCHSLHEKKRERVSSGVRANYRKVKLLALSAGFLAPYIPGSDRTVRTEDGPQVLLEAVRQMLNEQIPPKLNTALELIAKNAS